MLEPARAFAFGQGVRAPTLGGVRPGDRQLERVVREWNPPQHGELLLHFLITIEKHKVLPVFPGRSLDGGCEKSIVGGRGGCDTAFFGAGML